MNILASSYFESNLVELSKSKYRGEYGNVLKDCGKFLSELSDLKDVHKLGDVITHLDYEDDRKPVKLRINNSTTRKGKKGGYRIIVFVLDEDDTIVLVGLYCKTGSLGKSRQSPKELKAMLKDYLDSFEEDGEPLSEVEVLPNGHLSIVVESDEEE